MFEFDVCNTEELQLESLVLFANGLGYDEVYDADGKLLRFRSDKYKASGEQYVSVRRMIKMHNQLPNTVWSHIATVNQDFSTFIDSPEGEHMINILFAGNCKIVETVKGMWSHEKGFFVYPSKSNMMVKFCTKKLKRIYGHWVGE